jgi:hypothetical protein
VPTTLKVWGELDFNGVVEERDTAIVMAQFLLVAIRYHQVQSLLRPKWLEKTCKSY